MKGHFAKDHNSLTDEQQSAFGRDNDKKSHATDADSDDGIELVAEVTKPQAEPQKVSSYFKR